MSGPTIVSDLRRLPTVMDLFGEEDWEKNRFADDLTFSLFGNQSRLVTNCEYHQENQTQSLPLLLKKRKRKNSDVSASTPHQPERDNKNVKLDKKVKKRREKIRHKQEMTSTVERDGRSKNSIKREEPERKQLRSNSGKEFMRKKRKQTFHETHLHSCDMQTMLDQKKKTKSQAKGEENFDDIKVSEKKSSKLSSSKEITHVLQSSSHSQKNSEGDSTVLLSTNKQRKRKKKNNSKKNKYKHLALNNKDTCAGDDLQASKTAISQKNSKEILPQHIKDSSKDFQSCRNETEQPKTCKRKTKTTREKGDIINTDTQNTFQHAKKCDFVAAASSKEKLHGDDTDDDSYSSVSNFKDIESDNSGNLKNKKIKETNYSKEAETGAILQTRTQAKSSSFLDKAREKLEAARFRFLNEQLYTSSGKEALEMFKGDRESFEIYHKGFQGQVSRWPVNPLSTIIQQLKNKPTCKVIADFGCGDAQLAESLPRKTIYSFDLVALKPCVTVCDMSKVPLPKASVDAAVFCLSLMGTNLADYLCEANRVLKIGGMLLVAEVVSRFQGIISFVEKVEQLGFSIIKKTMMSKMFYLFIFKKVKATERKSAPSIMLKPCYYKRR